LLISSSGDLLGMDTPPAKPVVSRRTLLDQAQNSEPQDSTATSTVVAPVDLFELSPTKDVSDMQTTCAPSSTKPFTAKRLALPWFQFKQN
jgi:hypothetical protein